ncbi:MAG: Eco57I restriction-modification methylase domain-containing protein, partial [Rudaea sp.]
MSLFRQPLLNPSLVAKQLKPEPIDPGHAALLHGWAATIRDGSISTQKEIAIRRPFLDMLFVKILGYRPFGQGGEWTIHDEQAAGRGSVDTVLGLFAANAPAKIVAPFELKGPQTSDLDAIMPGRHKSPVQQAWEYANDTPGCRFVLVSNMIELRLYAVGHGRQAYETWQIVDLVNPSEYARLRLVLGASQLLGGATARLLESSAGAEKEITQKLYKDYRTLRVQMIVALAHANPTIALADIISHAQTLLDRVLFVAFAEDRTLLPEKTLDRAYRTRNEFNPQPIWENFRGLFRAIDRGNPSLGIPAYNGGLFAEDPGLDALTVGDDTCRAFQQLGEYDFASEVGVTVLGHIFEQSVADLEELREAAGTEGFELKAKEQVERGSARSVKGRRKDEGVVYTPDHITGFIVEQALGGYLAAAFERLLEGFVADPKAPRDAAGEIVWKQAAKNDPVRAKLPRTSKGKSAGSAKGDVADRAYEYLFWRDWLEFLKSVAVVDPACGSGAFLVAAFDWLHAEYRRVTEQLHAITGSYDLFDLNKAILNGNLYGVDLNAESVEITKLSLWLKTAERGKPLTSLEANIHLGNSLIRGQEFSERAFDWQAAFPQVFARGGFDVTIGNPPYVRMERIKPIKPYLEKHYEVVSDRADLYCYFYELGIKLLKPGGRLGFISSSSFLKTGSGEPLRAFLRARTRLHALVDFGDLQVFEGVTTYPVVLVAEKLADDAAADARAPIDYLVLDAPIDSLSAAFAQGRRQMPQAQLGAGSWQIESPRLAALRRKLCAGHPTLKNVYGSPLYGIKTGLNEAFVVDRATRDDLIRRDPRSADLLKPFLVG